MTSTDAGREVFNPGHFVYLLKRVCARLGWHCSFDPSLAVSPVFTIMPLNGAPYAFKIEDGGDEWYAKFTRVDGQAHGTSISAEGTVESILSMVVNAEVQAAS